jgi:hypothetical protein
MVLCVKNKMRDPVALCEISSRVFVPFNDSPRYLAATISRDHSGRMIIAGRAKYHLEGWYNVGGRTAVLDAHSFRFSVETTAKKNLGAYSVGILGVGGVPRINLSHFLQSSVSLTRSECPPNFYSGFGFDNAGTRFQHGLPAPLKAFNERHELSVEYSAEKRLLTCSANGSLVQEIAAQLDNFSLELRLEAIGVEGAFEVVFENLLYSCFDNKGTGNIAVLEAQGPAQAIPRMAAPEPEKHSAAPRLSLPSTTSSKFAEIMPSRTSRGISGIELFLSYSHRDERLREKLDKHLSALRRQGLIQIWNDRKVAAGDEFDQEISTHLESADLVLLLVSSEFIASDYCWGKELKRALERHQARQARVIPIILRPCDWHNTPFGNLVALPTDGRPVASARWPNTDSAFENIAAGIRKVVTEMTSTS